MTGFFVIAVDAVTVLTFLENFARSFVASVGIASASRISETFRQSYITGALWLSHWLLERRNRAVMIRSLLLSRARIIFDGR